MTDEEQYRLAYNAHETAESAMLAALRDSLEHASVEALTCLCDPQWRWETRSWVSATIIEVANEALNDKLDSMVECASLEASVAVRDC